MCQGEKDSQAWSGRSYSCTPRYCVQVVPRIPGGISPYIVFQFLNNSYNAPALQKQASKPLKMECNSTDQSSESALISIWKLLTWKANCPEKSYMPQECIKLKVFRTASGLRTLSPVIGQKPPLARVAAITLADSQVTSIEQSLWKRN